MYSPAGSSEVLLAVLLFFWIMYKNYIFMQCAPFLILCFLEDLQRLAELAARDRRPLIRYLGIAPISYVLSGDQWPPFSPDLEPMGLSALEFE